MNENYKIYDFDARNLPSEFLQAIGLTMACAANTEEIEQTMIAGLLGVDFEIGLAMTTHMTSPLRESIIRSLIEMRTDDDNILNKLDDIIKKVNMASKKRAAIAHGLWCKDQNTDQVFAIKITARAGLNYAFEPTNHKEIETDAMFIYETGLRLQKFLTENNFLPNDSPDNRSRSHMNKAARVRRRKSKM